MSSTEIEGRTYRATLLEGNVMLPLGTDRVFPSGTHGLLLRVNDVKGQSMALMAAPDDGEGEQDRCKESLSLAEWTDYGSAPFFEVKSNAVTLSGESSTLHLRDTKISGAFSVDGTRIDGLTIAATIDTRELIGISTHSLDWCEEVPGYRPCFECADGSGSYCTELYVDYMTAYLVDSTPLELVGLPEIESNPECQ